VFNVELHQPTAKHKEAKKRRSEENEGRRITLQGCRVAGL
jgi:hypothetical protein